MEGHPLSAAIFRSQVQQLHELLRRYIAKRAAEGAFREIDPLRAAGSFIGMVASHLLLEIFEQPASNHLAGEWAREEMIILSLNGVRHT